MSVDTLRDELLSLPGVADADVEVEGAAPANVRVRLHPEADPRAVGADVQRVLASHGMRSRVSGDEPAAATPAAAPPVMRPPAEPPPPPRPVMPPPLPEPIVTAPPAPAPISAEAAMAGGVVANLASLTVEESQDGVTVVATATDGRRFSQRTVAAEDAVAAAVVAVVGALADGRPPRLLTTLLGAAEGTEVVTVLVERVDSTRIAGAAVVKAGRPYAVARATWSALRS
jgi:hypothetical protein